MFMTDLCLNAYGRMTSTANFGKGLISISVKIWNDNIGIQDEVSESPQVSRYFSPRPNNPPWKAF